MWKEDFHHSTAKIGSYKLLGFFLKIKIYLISNLVTKDLECVGKQPLEINSEIKENVTQYYMTCIIRSQIDIPVDKIIFKKNHLLQ